MTGTEDESMIVDTQPEDRRVSFDQIGGVDQYLVTFIGGDHMVFSGRPRHWGEEPTDAVFQESIKRCATVYWDAYLRGDSEAMAWLAGEGFEAALAGQAELERKLEAR
jgi:hypothetical protein